MTFFHYVFDIRINMNLSSHTHFIFNYLNWARLTYGGFSYKYNFLIEMYVRTYEVQVGISNITLSYKNSKRKYKHLKS